MTPEEIIERAREEWVTGRTDPAANYDPIYRPATDCPPEVVAALLDALDVFRAQSWTPRTNPPELWHVCCNADYGQGHLENCRAGNALAVIEKELKP